MRSWVPILVRYANEDEHFVLVVPHTCDIKRQKSVLELDCWSLTPVTSKFESVGSGLKTT